MFARVLPAHLAHLERVFTLFSQKDFNNDKVTLKQLNEVFSCANGNFKEVS